MADSVERPICPWCTERHDTPLTLCPRCEQLAKLMKQKRGQPITEQSHPNP